MHWLELPVGQALAYRVWVDRLQELLLQKRNSNDEEYSSYRQQGAFSRFSTLTGRRAFGAWFAKQICNWRVFKTMDCFPDDIYARLNRMWAGCYKLFEQRYWRVRQLAIQSSWISLLINVTPNNYPWLGCSDARTLFLSRVGQTALVTSLHTYIMPYVSTAKTFNVNGILFWVGDAHVSAKSLWLMHKQV